MSLSPDSPRKPMTVTALTISVKLRLEEHYPGVLVAGEVSNFTKAASGHWYFSVKDAGATLRCVMFRGFALRTRFDPRDGTQVVVRGGLSLYPQRGEYQCIVEELTQQGVGSAELALRRLKEKLLQKGYFAPDRKRRLPLYPRRLALVASPTGAAIRDMLQILKTRWPYAEVIVRPSRVQGEGAAAEVAAALRTLSGLHVSRRLPLSAIVVGRGGGSSEDLAAFNEEAVADAIFESAVPVVSAVGHEIDVSVADMVADYRALTPSEAITALCPDCVAMLDGLTDTAARLDDAVTHRVALARQRLTQLAERPALRKPFERVREAEQKLDDWGTRLARAAERRLTRSGEQLAALADQLEGLSPLNVLKRGFTLTTLADGRLLRSAREVRPGDALRTRTPDGVVVSRVLETPGS